VQRKFRLTNSNDIQRVRGLGKSFSHPLVVLVVLPNDMTLSRIGVIASRAVGGAVQRNRAKRRLREAIQPLLASIEPGWDLILIARQSVGLARFEKIQSALAALLQRASLLNGNHGNGTNNSSTSG
jgi:ribonuclease P protein component